MAGVMISDGTLSGSVTGTEEWPVSGSGKPTINSALVKAYIEALFGAWTDYSPTYGGFSASPTPVYAKYNKVGKRVHVKILASTGTSNATTFTITLPFAAASVGIQSGCCPGAITNNGSSQTTPGRISTRVGSTTADVYLNTAAAAWTNTGAKGAAIDFIYFTD